MSRTVNEHLRLIYNKLIGVYPGDNLLVNVDSITVYYEFYLDAGSVPPSDGEILTDAATLGASTNLYVSKKCSSTIGMNNDRDIVIGAGMVNGVIKLSMQELESFIKVTTVADSGTFYTIGIEPLVVVSDVILDGLPVKLSLYRK